MSLDSDISFLSRLGIFSELPSDQIRLLAFSAERRELAAGSVLFEKGTTAKSGFVLTAGRLEFSDYVKGRRTVLAECEVGTLIGEMALIVDTPRPATAIAVERSEVMEISRALMMRMLNEYPQAAVRMGGAIRARLRSNLAELWEARSAFFVEREPLRLRAVI